MTTKEIRKIQALQHDRSFVVTLPKDFVKDLNLEKGDYISCTIASGRLILEKTRV
jgi:antitoxin component of MazEF toxin-antitoxin module